MKTASNLLELARLQARKGDLREARATLEGALDSENLGHPSLWIEAIRLHFACSQELEEASRSQHWIDQVFTFIKNTVDESLQAQGEVLIASWLLSQGKEEECLGYLQSSIQKATQSHHLSTLARTLLLLAITQTLNPANHGNALSQFDKLDVILAEIDETEIAISAKLFRGFIYTQKAQYDRALSVLWDAYDLAKTHGFYLHLSSILAQMARVYRDQNNDAEFKTFAKLAIKGLHQEKAPRLFKTISQICPQGLDGLRPSFDFMVDEARRIVKEKSKGVLDFKNQHILFEMTLLFIKNPGQRYSKEDLVEIIWNQVYDPELHDNLIYVSIKRLRTLLEPDMESPRYILRDRKGYYFNPQTVVQFHNLEEASI